MQDRVDRFAYVCFSSLVRLRCSLIYLAIMENIYAYVRPYFFQSVYFTTKTEFSKNVLKTF